MKSFETVMKLDEALIVTVFSSSTPQTLVIVAIYGFSLSSVLNESFFIRQVTVVFFVSTTVQSTAVPLTLIVGTSVTSAAKTTVKLNLSSVYSNF